MVRLPVLTNLRVQGYEMFPGKPTGKGISWSFQPGVTVVAGINGLGKTTLLTIILRSFTGPYDLSGDGGTGALNVVLPEKPVPLSSQHTRFFQRRVSDGAERAKVTLSATIGDVAVTITRLLKDLSLEEFKVNEVAEDLPHKKQLREEQFQARLTELIGLGNFVDVLLVLHHVVLFLENRPGALWDTNAQRQLLRALCLTQEDARRVADLERNLQSADSQARNIHTRITATEKRWRKVLREEAEAEGVIAELSAQQELLDADLKVADSLDVALQELDDDRRDLRLAFERAKLEREEADGAIERLKYTKLLRHYPKMDDAALMVLSKIMAEGKCLVCNAVVPAKQENLELQIAKGNCPICGSEPSAQVNIVTTQEFEQAKLDQEKQRAERARREETTQHERLKAAVHQHKETLARLETVRRSIRIRTEKNQRLRTKLPDTITSKDHEKTLQSLRQEHSEWQRKRTIQLKTLRTLYAERRNEITSKSEMLLDAFTRTIETLLVEEARLVQVSSEPDYMQAPGQIGDRVEVPAYVAEMKAATRSTFVRRNDASEVSESQRELIDLAFRLALVDVFGGSCTFVMETPEASLDGVAMERVGRALSAFAMRGDNRLVVTSNLTNAGILTALFDGTDPNSNRNTRMQRVLNLLEVAAPNRALLEEGERYSALLAESVAGGSQ